MTEHLIVNVIRSHTSVTAALQDGEELRGENRSIVGSIRGKCEGDRSVFLDTLKGSKLWGYIVITDEAEKRANPWRGLATSS